MDETETGSGWQLYDAVGEEDKLQQGDLIRFIEKEGENNSTRFGLVITADCDLDKRKHSRLVTLISVITVDTLVSSCLGIDCLEQNRQSLADYCRKQLGVSVASTDASFLGHVKAHAIMMPKRPAIVDLAISALFQELESISVAQLKELFSILNISSSKIKEKFSQQAVSRGDLMILPPPPAITGAPRVAWLRRIWQEQIGKIAIRNSDENNSVGLRVARLESPFRYRLTQQVAHVFSDIGLPDIDSKEIMGHISALDI